MILKFFVHVLIFASAVQPQTAPSARKSTKSSKQASISSIPTLEPDFSLSDISPRPTPAPTTRLPSRYPTNPPTSFPSSAPTKTPSTRPTVFPSAHPTDIPVYSCSEFLIESSLFPSQRYNTRFRVDLKGSNASIEVQYAIWSSTASFSFIYEGALVATAEIDSSDSSISVPVFGTSQILEVFVLTSKLEDYWIIDVPCIIG